ncbi:MAG: diiron oxygenase, partial [Planctomycetaceae bacterium]|nr:diiron oxygenase [Planctomycetaceae bacterium]
PWAKKLLKFITTRPMLFPVVFWIMLALEERSLDISHRTLHLDEDTIEPRYRMIYREHLKDEARHVQLDWHLIERFYVPRRSSVRKVNAWLLKQMLGRFFLPPTRSAVRVVQYLAKEDAWLLSQLPEIKRQLKQVGLNPNYYEMMYSRKTTPILFSLFDRFPELQIMQKVLKSYTPHGQEG